jgi:hypothetical protein
MLCSNCSIASKPVQPTQPEKQSIAQKLTNFVNRAQCLASPATKKQQQKQPKTKTQEIVTQQKKQQPPRIGSQKLLDSIVLPSRTCKELQKTNKHRQRLGVSNGPKKHEYEFRTEPRSRSPHNGLNDCPSLRYVLWDGVNRQDKHRRHSVRFDFPDDYGEPAVGTDEGKKQTINPLLAAQINQDI